MQDFIVYQGYAFCRFVILTFFIEFLQAEAKDIIHG